MAINYAANKRYFEPSALMGVGGILALAGFITVLSSEFWVGVAMIVLGIVLCVWDKKNTATAEQIDQQCQEEVANIKDRALQKLGIDADQVAEADPIFFDGYLYNESLWKPKFKEEKKVWRTSNYEATVFFFSAEQIYCYEYTFSLTEENKKESTEEYFYKDIVSVSTKSADAKLKNSKGKETTFNYEHFMLTTSGGTSISAMFRDMESAEKSINGMKQLLRQKKSSN